MSLPPRLGRLHQVSRLGAGGFASVWLYRDETLRSLVAVKALADNWSQRTDVRDRFLEEARILRRADSDHVVRVYDIGETADGTPYFVMSYADAGTVADLLPQAPLPVAQVADLVEQACSGLSVLHRIGVVHRDVKPQNLLLHNGSDGVRLVVGDLGVAKAVAYASTLTLVVGTPAYMAPEQADPSAGLDRRADVHALGAVAYHLLTGTVIRSGGVESVLRPTVPVPPTHLVADLPPEIDRVIGRAVHPDPDQRWPDVSSFGTALRAIAGARQPTLISQPDPDTTSQWTATDLLPVGPGPGGETPPDRRRSPLRWLAPLALVIAAAAAVGGWYAVDRFGGSPDAPTPGVEQTADELGMELPDAWDEADRTASRVDYRHPERDLLVRLDVAGSDRPPRVVAAQYLDEVQGVEGFGVLADEPLPEADRAGWDNGWLVRYEYLFGGQPRLMEAWYVGDDGTTAGFVAAAAPDGEGLEIIQLLPRALAALPGSAGLTPTETVPFPGRWLTTDLDDQERTDVAQVQEQLNRLGYGPIPVDGEYGDVTESKVRDYQADHGLVVDGKVGPETWAALFR